MDLLETSGGKLEQQQFPMAGAGLRSHTLFRLQTVHWRLAPASVGSFSSPRISDEPNTDFFFSFYQQPQTGKTKITEFKLCPIFCDTLRWDLKMQGVEIKPKVGMYWYQRPHFLLVELPFLNVYLWNRVCSEFIVSAVHLLPTDRKKRWSKDQTKITH